VGGGGGGGGGGNAVRGPLPGGLPYKKEGVLVGKFKKNF